MKVYAVIDTNVIISSMLTHNIASPTKMVLSYVRDAVERMRASALANGLADMSMEEIDEEIRQYREEKMLKRRQSV